MTLKPTVSKIKFHQKSQLLELAFADGLHGELTAEFLRVHSPSAEVQGHGSPKLVENKATVQLLEIQSVGHYAVRLIFNDGHRTGIYSWQWLHYLVAFKNDLWTEYRTKIRQKAAKNALNIPISVEF